MREMLFAEESEQSLGQPVKIVILSRFLVADHRTMRQAATNSPSTTVLGICQRCAECIWTGQSLSTLRGILPQDTV